RGSDGASGGGGGRQTCVLVETGPRRAVHGRGAMSKLAMKREGVEPLTLDAVLLTRLHGDHFGGLPFLILDAQFRRRTQPLVIAGPTGVEYRVLDAMEMMFPGSSRTGRRFEVQYLELENRRPAALAGISVTPYEVVHASGAPPLALRV